MGLTTLASNVEPNMKIYDVINFVFSQRNDSLHSDTYPGKSDVMMPKSLFKVKMVFLIQNYTLQPTSAIFLKTEKFHVSNFL